MTTTAPPGLLRVSVVLPYYENSRTLLPCLRALCDQTFPPDEIIVVDDGSQDAASAIINTKPWPLPVRLYTTAHRGQSGATNVGIRAAQGDLVLLTCADIIADQHLVSVHHEAHSLSTVPLAVIGYLPYASTVKMTPIMRFLEEPDVQFAFAKIADPDNVSHVYCYAPNLSVRKDLLIRVGMFDEKFVYGYQDTDLGKRLAAAGARFVYRRDAIGHHDHPTHLRAVLRRQYAVGEATLYWLEKYQNPAEITRMRSVVAQYYPLLGSLESYMLEAEKMEKLLETRPVLLQACKPRLFQLYTLIFNTAIVAGMAQSLERLRAILGSQRDPLTAGTAEP